MKKIRNLVIGIVCITLVVGLYYYVINREPSAAKKESELSEIQTLILKDLEGKSYPETPRSVIKLYTRIQRCFYNDEYTEEEFKQLSKQARNLMDQELLNKNPEEVYNASLQSEVTDYKENSRTISSITLSDSNDVIYKKVDGNECAYVKASYFIREGKGFYRTAQKYVLKKGEDDKWKILGFEPIEGEIDE